MNSIPCTSCWLVHATVSDPDLDWIKMKWGLWIWIQESKNYPQKKGEEISYFVVLDVLFEGLEASPVARKTFKEA